MVATRSQTKATAPESSASAIDANTSASGNNRALTTKKATSRGAVPKKTKQSKAQHENIETSITQTISSAPANKATGGRASNSNGSTPKIVQPEQVNQPKSIFDLPPEIRNDIWTMAVVQDSMIPVEPVRPFLQEPALLAVNQQVRSETMSIWYAEHHFEIMGSSPAVKFLRSRTDQQLRSIRCLHITSEKSEKMRLTPSVWIEHLQNKVRTIMREFEDRGFRAKALKFQVISNAELQWLNGEEVQIAGVTGLPDKGKRIRGGPRKGQKVPGSASQKIATPNPES